MVRVPHTSLILLTLILLLIINSYSQEIIPRLERITVEDGLPENSVTCIIQDHLGFLWLGTMNGLVRYDGYSMKVYRPDPADTSSISQPSITALYEDKSGTIWVGTRLYNDGGGLNRFERGTEKFTCYINDQSDSSSISSNNVFNICEDSEGRLWIGTERGLSLFNPENNTFLNYYFLDSSFSKKTDIDLLKQSYGTVRNIVEDPTTGNLLFASNLPGLWTFDVNLKIFFRSTLLDDYLGSNIGKINSLNVTKDKKILIATENSLVKYDPHLKQIIFSKDIPEFKYNSIFDGAVLLEDKSGLIWIGNYQEGLITFNPSNQQLYRISEDFRENEDFFGLRILSLIEDQSGIVWIGTQWAGLYKYDRKKKKFNYYSYNPHSVNSLRPEPIYVIYEDKKENLWIGGTNTLTKFDPINNKFSHFRNEKNNINSLSEGQLWCIVEDPIETEVYWIGTIGGLNKFNLSKSTFTRYEYDSENKDGISHNYVMNLLVDREGALWVGTFGGGLDRFDRKTGTFSHFRFSPNDSTSLSQDRVSMIYEDRRGTIWIGTDTQGLNRFDPDNGKFIRYKSLSQGGGTSSITYIYEDRNGNFWLGTLKSGIHLFDPDKGISIRNYTVKDGLPNDYVTAILEDDSGNLWIGTENGLSKFNPQTESFRNYYNSDGLEGNIFSLKSAYKSKSGIMYFGGEYGLDFFHPDSIKDDLIPPKVVIDNISLFNREDEKIIFDKSFPELDEITLSYNQNDLRFDFVGLHYSEPSKNRYTYKLAGYNFDWIDAGTQHNATYTNLDPGEYVFMVKAANRDGVWNEAGASIKIIILPPWWATTWAYIIYVLILLSLIYITWKMKLNRIRIKHNYEMSKFEAEKMKEVNEMKNRFFANISHEFRTPLTLIFGPAKDIAEETKETKTKQNAGIIKRNASRLYRLVNQLLELSKLEAGKMKLQVTEQNVMPLLKGLVLSFSSLADRKEITLNFNTIEQNLKVYIDKEKVEKVINNLLSNAFNFTPEGGKIDFTVEKLIKEAEIRIADNGVGIPKERINKIFDRFYQVDGSSTRVSEGTGIGLALTKELVELHRGKIKVESNEGEGTTFTVLLPLGNEHLKPDEIVEKDNGEETAEIKEETKLPQETESHKEKTGHI